VHTLKCIISTTNLTIVIQTGEIARYAIVGGIIVLILAWMVGGYYHAQRRLRQGKPPLLYHRWLVPKSQRYLSQVAPSHTYPQYSAPPARQYGRGNTLDQGAVYREQEYNLNSWNHTAGPPGMHSTVHASVLHAMLHICYVSSNANNYAVAAYSHDIPPAYQPPPGGSKGDAMHIVNDLPAREESAQAPYQASGSAAGLQHPILAYH